MTSVVKLLATQISPQKSEDRVCLKLLIYCVMSDILPGYTGKLNRVSWRGFYLKLALGWLCTKN